ncbi:multicopper oxidase family protein [Acidicapsa acidisoli]|uniref:multicopper oxidase family protein n=1 Tax=Acidicapsa acidisoli TaxID=1615681 RepID=UPI0021DF761C|nr:multicopper oxidase domain-containing protein [Acidicapsa acidisoli]
MYARRSNTSKTKTHIATMFCLFIHVNLHAQQLHQAASNGDLPEPPEVRRPFVLDAVSDPTSGKAAFSFEGREVPPVIRTQPGGTIRVEYVNRMSSKSRELCVDGPCTNMTNLHFHGLHVSPNAPQDDVLLMMAMPGQSLHYVVDIPLDQPPGLYWYHTHPHGESYRQDLDGMSGAIVIDGIDRYVPEVRSMKERILTLRDAELHEHDAESSYLKEQVQLSPAACGAATGEPQRIFTVNGVVRPQIGIAPGEKQFWRIVNASPDLYADLEIDTEQLTVLALDGMPLAYHDPRRRTESLQHVLLAPAGRVETIVVGPNAGVHAALRTRCVDTGADGDPNPAMVVADLRTTNPATSHVPSVSPSTRKAVYKTLSPSLVRTLESGEPEFTVKFTEDLHGFYVNDKKYSPTDGPMITVKIGHYAHWRVVNNSHEIHPFHIHQVHFLVFQESGKKTAGPEWLDTVNIAPEGSVDLIMDFTDPIIRGISVLHCHLLKHEDKGMMAKILFQ